MNDLDVVHPGPGQLQAYSLGRLGPAELAEVERHVAVCDACRQALGSLPYTLPEQERTPPGCDSGEATAAYSSGAGPPPDSTTAPPAGCEVPEDLVNHPRYRVLELLGAGGMGTVYKAEHRLMGRLVALKVINRDLVGRPAAVGRFRREVQAAARLSHPNIVTAHDAEQAGTTHFLVMEFVAGTSLAQAVAEQGMLPVRRACDYARQVALGLQHACERGMYTATSSRTT